MNAHSIVSVATKAAEVVVVNGQSYSGLDGWEAVCSCGFRTGSSLGERWAAKQGAEHVAWMTRSAR